MASTVVLAGPAWQEACSVSSSINPNLCRGRIFTSGRICAEFFSISSSTGHICSENTLSSGKTRAGFSSILSSTGHICRGIIISSGRIHGEFSGRCSPRSTTKVFCCANEITKDTLLPKDGNESSSLGRREALVLSSLVAGVSIVVPAVLPGLDNHESVVLLEQSKMVVENNVFNEGVSVQAGITSKYIRPAAASPDLPLQSLLQQQKTAQSLTTDSVPSQVYVSLHGPNRIQVSWITPSAGASTVDYGSSPGNYPATAVGTNSTYTYEDYTSGNIHYVVIGPLNDDATYFYRVGGSGPEFSFKTPPPEGPDVPINFIVVGDLGQTSNTQSTLQHIKGKEYDVLILPGDLSYADGDQPRWDSYGQLISPLASSRPWMVTQGNHEIEPSLGIEDFRAYNARWKMPYALSGSDSNLFYSFDVAGVHFLMLGSYADYSPGSDQFKWLQNDLARVERSKTPWLIGVLHAPWYNSNLAHQGEGNGMLAAMEDLLFGAEVDIVFAGHVHAYERSVRTYKGKPNSRGILYLNIGDGGNREGLAKLYLPQPRWSTFRESSYGHGELSISSSSTAAWTWHRNQDDEAVVADSVVITSLSSESLPQTLKLESSML